VQPHITDSAAFLRWVGGDCHFCGCCSLGIAHALQNGLQPWMYLDTPQSSSLVKIQLAFCSQESLVFVCVGSCCFKSKRLLTKPLPSKQQIYGPPVRRRLWNVVFLIHFQECSSGLSLDGESHYAIQIVSEFFCDS